MLKDRFDSRHIGPRDHELKEMLGKIGVSSVDELIDQTVPKDIRLKNELNIHEGLSEHEFARKIKEIASRNKLFKSFIGMGYYGTHTPAVIKRNILENPGWYTSYTPYQAEISQGRLEALLNFQTVIIDLTGMEISNCSLLDEATSAAEAMIMMYNSRSRQATKDGKNVIFIDENIFPQTMDVLKTRSTPLSIEIQTGNARNARFSEKTFGAIVQYPGADGEIVDFTEFADNAHKNEIMVTAIADVLSLTLLKSPGEWGADIVVGSTQRFGVPLGYGGPHAGYLAAKDAFKRQMPGRIIGISVDRHGKQALRMALQTREQHIKRERATSNICTAQALLASMAAMYAVYHGPEGLKNIALHAHNTAVALSNELEQLGYTLKHKNFFDTIEINLPGNLKSSDIQALALKKEMNFFYKDDKTVKISTDELISLEDINAIREIFATAHKKSSPEITEIPSGIHFDKKFERKSEYLKAEIFHKYRSETEMMRYLHKLARRDISLTQSMIPLGSCTMKLNSAAELLPISWDEFGGLHPFVPVKQAEGYMEMINELEKDLAEITGFSAVSLQPNSGAAGEHTGLMVIREYHMNRGEGHRDIVLIPSSAHGTNPASGVMAGMKVVVTKCDEKGNIDIDDLRAKAEEHKDHLSAFMVTYPSTHGVFESRIKEMMDIIHQNGGQVYMDGANMNAQVGLTNPGIINADVCHLNLHKTFAIPHGGGGPGIGPIAVASHLAPFLPGHPLVKTGGEKAISAVAAAPYGSASILPITYGYIKMLGKAGLRKASEMAIVNANYLAAGLKKHYNILYTGETGRCAHEMILDCQSFRHTYGIEAADIARRLMDFGFHAPTLSFPVHETLMVEPTESESKQELDRFIDAMIQIKNELEEIKAGKMGPEDNVLKNAPHTAEEIASDNWGHSYNREKAAFPLAWVKENKFWPFVGKIDSGYGDRNLVCTCESIESYM